MPRIIRTRAVAFNHEKLAKFAPDRKPALAASNALLNPQTSVSRAMKPPAKTSAAPPSALRFIPAMPPVVVDVTRWHCSRKRSMCPAGAEHSWSTRPKRTGR